MDDSELLENLLIDYFQNAIGILSKNWSSNIKYLYVQNLVSSELVSLFNKYEIPFYKENIDDKSVRFTYLEHYDRNDQTKFKYYQNFSNDLFFIISGCEVKPTGILRRNTRREDVLQFPNISNIIYDYFIFNNSDMVAIDKIINDKYDFVIEFKQFQLYNNNFTYFLITSDSFRELENRTYNILCLLNSCNISYFILSDSHSKMNIRNECKNSENKKHYAHYYRFDLKMPFRSSWEANIARILNYKNITWKYENGSFERHDIKDRNTIIGYYFPDFFYRAKCYYRS